MSFLVGIWNFQKTTQDDRGFDLDGSIHTNFHLHSGTTLKGFYSLDVTSGSDIVVINVPESKRALVTAPKQFDIFIKYMTKSSTITDDRVLVQLQNDTTQINMGLVPQSATTFKPFITIGTIKYTNDNIIKVTDNAPVTFRLKRVNGIITMYADSIPVLEQSDETSFDNITQINIGGIFNKGCFGYINQCRLYCGGTVDLVDSERIQIAKLQPNTIKYAGIVTNVYDKTFEKKVTCRSHSATLLQNIDKKLIDEAGSSTDLTHVIEKDDLGTFTDVTTDTFNMTPILKKTLSLVDSSYTLLADDLYIPKTEITFQDTFIDILTAICLHENLTFFITPRKTIILEPYRGIVTDILFENGSNNNFDVTVSEHRNDKTARRITVIGKNNAIGYSSTSDTFAKTQSLYFPFISEELLLTQIATTASIRFNTFGSNRYEINCAGLVNYVRISQGCYLKNPNKFMGTEYSLIQQISYHYPQASTTISLGINKIDLYDELNTIQGDTLAFANNTISDSTSTPQETPVVSITSPTSDYIGLSTIQVNFACVVTESSETLYATWSSDDGTVLQSNSNSFSASLPIGTHVITATVINSAGTHGAASISVTITGTPPTGSTSKPIITTEVGKVNVSWNKNLTDGSATGYSIERKVGTGSYSGIGNTIGIDATTFSDEFDINNSTHTAHAGELLTYRVIATNDYGSAPPSTESTYTLPSVPTVPYFDVDDFRDGNTQYILLILSPANSTTGSVDVSIGSDSNYSTLFSNRSIYTRSDSAFNTFKNAYNDQHSNQIINGKTPFEYSEDDDETIYYGYTVSVPSENTRYYYRASSTASVWGKSAYSSKNTRIEP